MITSSADFSNSNPVPTCCSVKVIHIYQKCRDQPSSSPQLPRLQWNPLGQLLPSVVPVPATDRLRLLLQVSVGTIYCNVVALRPETQVSLTEKSHTEISREVICCRARTWCQSLEFTWRNSQQEFISEVTDDCLADFRQSR